MARIKLLALAIGVAAALIGASAGIAFLVESNGARGPDRSPAGPALPAPSSAASGMGTPDAETQIAFWSRRLADNPSGYLDLVNLGEAFARKARETGDVGSYQRAEAALRRALEIAPRYVPTTALLSSVLFSTHDFGGALELAKPVAGTLEGIQALATEGDVYLALGRYEEAERAYASLRAASGAPSVLSRQAALLDARGEPERALALMLRAARLAETSGDGGESLAWYQFQVGELDFRAGRLELAEQQYEAALRSFPDYYLGLGGLARVRAAEGAYAAAIELYERATAIVPQPELLSALGDVYALTGRGELAREQYETVEFIGTLARVNRQVYNRQLALFYADHDIRVDEALRLALDELRVRRDVFGFDTAAWAAYKNGLLDRAQELSDEARRLGTRDARLSYHAGMIAAARGRTSEARRLLTEALAINPHFDLLQARTARAALAGL